MRTLSSLMVVGMLATLRIAAAVASEDVAREAFDEGRALFEEERYEEAADAFTRAYELKPNWKLLYNLGQSQAAARHYGLALVTFERYLAEGGDELADSRRDEVLAEVERLRKMVGSLEIRGPDGARVFVDDTERGIVPLPGLVHVVAGLEHRVLVQLGVETLLERTVRVSGGQTMVIDLGDPEAEAEVGPEEEQRPPPPSEPPPVTPEQPAPAGDSGITPLQTLGLVMVGVGGALLAGGAVTGGMTLSLDGEVEDGCPDGECAPDMHDTLERRDNLALATDVLLGVGVAAAVVGATMVFVGGAGDKGEEEPDAEVALGPGTASLSWRF
ncbi:MAG: tetratricopeptide repeat protein [Deltaproteobacteria bacterium]|jgi:hypothetical protein|nr:tetratricopeptide repeat protein [Deltaproteobacteria bacterium]